MKVTMAQPAQLLIGESERRAAERYEALVRVSQAIGIHREPKTLFDVLSCELRRVIDFDGFGVAQFDSATGKIHWHISIKCNEQDVSLPSGCSQEESMTCWVFEHQQPVVVRDLNEETRFSDTVAKLRKYNIRSVCTFPLTTVHRRIGSLFLASERPNAYSESEVRFLTLVADQIALAVDDALNYESSRRAQERLELLLELTNGIISTRDLRELLRNFSASVRRVMQCDFVGVGLPEPDKKNLRLHAIDFPESRGFLTEELLIPIEGTPPGEAFLSGKPVVTNKDEIEEVDPKAPPMSEGLRHACILPLSSHGQVRGVLGLARRDDNAFAESDVQFLTQVANQVAIAVENALAFGKISELKEKLNQEKLYLEDEIRTEMNFEEIIGKSPVLKRVLKQVSTVAPTDSTVLIYGETGTGKELIARAIHTLSSRNGSAFVKLNCAAIPTGLLESELFGHEKGAFTGAIAQRIGRFELANRGTVFLDEIGEIPLELQPKLLRVLQEREFERLGSTRTMSTNARLIAATNRDLSDMVDEQKFRPDLFYRLNVFPVRVPSLRERPDDIPLLVRHFAEQFARRMNKKIETIPADTLKALQTYHWPGNIRELQNVIERAVILSAGTTLHIPLSELQSQPAPSNTIASPESKSSAIRGKGIRNVLEDAERQHIIAALNRANWVVAGPNGAAVQLGMKRSTLQLRIQKLGISREIASPASAS